MSSPGSEGEDLSDPLSIVRAVLGHPASAQIDSTMRLRQDLGASPEKVANMVSIAEERFEVTMPDPADIVTVANFLEELRLALIRGLP